MQWCISSSSLLCSPVLLYPGGEAKETQYSSSFEVLVCAMQKYTYIHFLRSAFGNLCIYLRYIARNTTENLHLRQTSVLWFHNITRIYIFYFMFLLWAESKDLDIWKTIRHTMEFWCKKRRILVLIICLTVITVFSLGKLYLVLFCYLFSNKISSALLLSVLLFFYDEFEHW